MAYTDYPIDLPDALPIRDRQGEHEGNRIARDQSGGRGILGSGEPGFHHRAQQTERQNGDENSKHGQTGAQFVAQGVAQNEFQEIHESFSGAAKCASCLRDALNQTESEGVPVSASSPLSRCLIR